MVVRFPFIFLQIKEHPSIFKSLQSQAAGTGRGRNFVPTLTLQYPLQDTNLPSKGHTLQREPAIALANKNTASFLSNLSLFQTFEG